MSGNAQTTSGFQVQPPHGQRTPLGGGTVPPLQPGAAPAPIGGAPVPPTQPAWAQPMHAPPVAPPVVIHDGAGQDVTAQLVTALQANATIPEIQVYYPTATAPALRALAAERGLTVNEGAAPTPAAAQPPPPQAGPPPQPAAAPQPQLPAVAAEKRKRINKKNDLPRIEQLLKEGAGPEQISNAIGLDLAKVQKAIAENFAADPRQGDLPHVGTPANPVTEVGQPRSAEDDETAYEAPAVLSSETLSSSVERALFCAHEVMTFAKARNLSLEEVEAAAKLLQVVEA